MVRTWQGEMPEGPYQRQERIEREHAEMKAQLTKLEDALRFGDFPASIKDKVGLVPAVDIVVDLIERAIWE